MICGHQREDDCGCVSARTNPKPAPATDEEIAHGRITLDEMYACKDDCPALHGGRCFRCSIHPAILVRIDADRAENERLQGIIMGTSAEYRVTLGVNLRRYWSAENQVMLGRMLFDEDVPALRAELAQARDEIAAIKRQAEDATEYVLAVDNRELRKEIEGLRIRVGEYEDMTEINKRFSEIEAELASAREEIAKANGFFNAAVRDLARSVARSEELEAALSEMVDAFGPYASRACERTSPEYKTAKKARAILAARAKEGESRG